MQNKTIIIATIILVIIVGGYFLLRGDNQNSTSVPTLEKTEELTEILSATQVSANGITEIDVIGTEFSFNPSNISVKAGEQVKITFKNNGRAPHNLILEGLGIGTKIISGGQTDIIEFAAPASGTYTFFCSVSNHRASGMEGSFKVQ